jgi:hypothetical protein
VYRRHWREVGQPGSAFFAALIATAMPPGRLDPNRCPTARLDQVGAMLACAQARGEKPPSLADVMDHLLAPLYARALFGTPASEAFAAQLVERLLEVGKFAR